MRVLRVHRSSRGLGTLLRAFVRLLTLQLAHGVICRGSSTSPDRRRLHYCVMKASSALLCLPDPLQVEEVDTEPYPASQSSANSVFLHKLTHLVTFALPLYLVRCDFERP